MKSNAVRPGVHVRAQARGCVSMSGAQLLAETARVSGLDVGLSVALERWRRPRSIHDPGKIVLDLAVILAAGGDCPADASVLRAGAELFGPVASAPTISRLGDDLAGDLEAALAAVRSARAEARAWVRHLAGADRAGVQASGPGVSIAAATSARA